jgi:hypothetical protein
MSCHDIDFVAFYLTRKYDLGLLGKNAISKLRRHLVRTVGVQAKLLANLCIGQVEPHEVEAQYPYAKRLVVACKNGSSEIIKVSSAIPAMITLPISLSLIKTAFRKERSWDEGKIMGRRKDNGTGKIMGRER